jgi:hypothetical protein
VTTGTVPKKSRPQPKGGSRKGIPNKTTVAAKDAIAAAALALGGADRLVKWAKEHPANERIFWGTIYPKLLPLQLSGDAAEPLIVKIMRPDA